MTEAMKRQPPYRRRSARIVMRVPLLINAAGSSPGTDWEAVETIIISLHGGMIRTHRDLQVGTMLDIRMRKKNRSARARVVWRSSEVTAEGVETSFEILDDPDFWEMRFPPDRWP